MGKFPFHFVNNEKLPCVIQSSGKKQAPLEDLIDFLHREQALFKAQLLAYGAILLRGFAVRSADDFAEVIRACNLGRLFHYDVCVIPRTKIREGIYTSINAPESSALALHNEKSYSPDFPSHIYFYCQQAPKEGGSTPLANAHQVWLDLPLPLQQKLHDKGIMYCKYYYGKSLRQRYVNLIGGKVYGQTWMNIFKTDSKEDVERILQARNEPFRWVSKGNGLMVESVLPAHRHHPVNQKVVWFNQSDHNNIYYSGSYAKMTHQIKNPIARLILSRPSFLSYLAHYGDGEWITQSEADAMHIAIEKNKVSTPWKSGDVMVVDNYLCMHGKESHRGDRLILTAMTKDDAVISH